MLEMDLEDYIEEVKFQMTDAYDDVLDKEKILAWEKKARAWILKEHKKYAYIRFRSKDEIYVKIKNEEICEKEAKKFYEAVIHKTEENYWKRFELV